MYGPLVKKLASREIDDEEMGKIILKIPKAPPHDKLSHKRKVSREWKRRRILKCTNVDRFDRLLKMFLTNLGTTATVDGFVHLGREIGLKEYNALINLCIKKARETSDEYVATEEMSKAFHIMRESGFQLEEQTYRPVLQYIIDMGL